MFNKRVIIVPVVLILLAGTIASLGSEPAASEPGMDTDLGLSVASFIGEHAGDMSGMYISGAGDVNGDGYDDFVVGAPASDAGGSSRGQAYLILGRPSGWVNDVNLSNVNASFVGEADGDSAGNVVGVGDVNGDGYDDIVVAALQNDEGGKDAGQAYLILGSHSGWSMNTSLSSSDASFIGENAGDRAGQRVAGAGDVNGDGYDDILIGSYSNDDGGENAGKVYLVLGKASGWSMDTSLSSASASFIGEDADDSAARCAGAGDVDGDGYDDILIGAVTDSDVDEYAGQVYLVLGRASGWSKDTDLSNADASFLGEGSWDFCGDGTGVEDVNGDGYDDILIGASGNDSGRGKSYLIFGRTSGWTMDTNVSQAANASFVGEKKDDYAYGICGAGDVNGDGYHDFLIDASGNDEVMLDRGQMYLVLGKGSGWSLNTSLSDADASFLGENKEDALRTGAGAGDVNGDGRDDILMGSYMNDDGGTSAGKTYLIFYDDGEDPKVDMGATPRVATTGDAFSFVLNASDDTGIRSVHFEYWFGTDTTHQNASAVRTSGDQWMSTWTLNMTVPENRVATLHYRSHVWDRAFNLVSSGVQDVTVLDDDPPTFERDLTHPTATTGDAIFFQVEVKDNVNVSQVIVNYYFEGTGVNHTQYMMRVPPGTTDLWTMGISVPSDSLAYLHYQFGAVDNSSNGNLTDWSVIIIFDDDAPEFIEDLTDPTATTASDHVLGVRVSDNINLLQVRVEYWFEDWSSRNVSLVNQGSNVWNVTIWVPANTVGPLHYSFYAADNSSNVNVTGIRHAQVLDDTPPYFNIDLSDTEATTGDPFGFLINVTDNINLTEVRVVYWFGTGAERNVSMDPGPNDPWDLTVTIPSDSLETLHYRFYAVDNSSNIAVSGTTSVVVTDNDLPVLGEDQTPLEAIFGQLLHFEIEASDNVGVHQVVVVYQWSRDPTVDLDLVLENGTYQGDLLIDRYYPPFQYLIRVHDTSGNVVATTTRTVPKVDAVDPVVTDDLSDTSATTGDPFHIKLRLWDDVGINGSSLGEGWSPVSVDQYGIGVYEAWMAIAIDETGQRHFSITFKDLYGNGGSYELTTPEIEDDDRPVIEYEHELAEVPRGTYLNLSASATDNIGVEGLFIIYLFTGEGPVNASLDGRIELHLPREGDLRFTLSAVDAAGNWATTGEYTIALVNVAPTISALPDWDIEEGMFGGMPLASYIEEVNGDPLTITCSDPLVTVRQDAMLLELHHDSWVPERVVTITVSDGEETATADLRITVINVNDPPVITGLVPERDTIVDEDETVVLSVTAEDEDGDELTISWMEGDRVLGTGSPLRVRLDPGIHTITVLVDDGTAQVEDSVTVGVNSVSEPTGLWVVILALVVGGAVIAVVLLKRRAPKGDEET